MANVTQAVDIKPIAVALNACIEACIDGQKTYALAAANVRNTSLKEMLQEHSDQRARFVVQLQNALRMLGVTPENEGSLRGAARQRLMELRHAIEPMHNDFAVIRQCVRDQEAALRRFGAAVRTLSFASLPVDVRVMLDEQHGAIALTLEETRRRLDAH